MRHGSGRPADGECKFSVVKGDALVGVIAVHAARDIQQYDIAFAQAALGRADGLHGDAGADRAGGAVECCGAQTVFAEAGNAQHILGRGLVEAGDAHGATVEHRGADLAAKARLADTGAQQGRRDLFDDLLVQASGLAHAVQLVLALYRAQLRKHIVRGFWRKREDICSAWPAFAASWCGLPHKRFPVYAGKGFRNAAEAAERADIIKQRFLSCAVIGATHEQKRLYQGVMTSAPSCIVPVK